MHLHLWRLCISMKPCWDWASSRVLQRWSKAVQYRLSSVAGVKKIAVIYGLIMQPGLVLAPRGTTYMAFSSAAAGEGTHLGVGQERACCGGVLVFFALAAGYGLRSSTAIVYSVLFLWSCMPEGLAESQGVGDSFHSPWVCWLVLSPDYSGGLRGCRTLCGG